MKNRWFALTVQTPNGVEAPMPYYRPWRVERGEWARVVVGPQRGSAVRPALRRKRRPAARLLQWREGGAIAGQDDPKGRLVRQGRQKPGQPSTLAQNHS
jgi:hypothetical protein